MGTHTPRPLLKLLMPPSHRRTDRTRRPWAVAAAGAGALLLVADGHRRGDARPGRRYRRPLLPPGRAVPGAPDRRGQRRASGWPASFPREVVTADVPANGSAFLYAFHGRPVLFESLLLDPDPDHALIGDHLRDAAYPAGRVRRAAPGRRRVRGHGPERYWLNLYKRTAGIAKLEEAPGFQQVASAGRYKLFRIRACGFDPDWLAPAV